jgi:hypothetical protein
VTRICVRTLFPKDRNKAATCATAQAYVIFFLQFFSLYSTVAVNFCTINKLCRVQIDQAPVKRVTQLDRGRSTLRPRRVTLTAALGCADMVQRLLTELMQVLN